MGEIDDSSFVNVGTRVLHVDGLTVDVGIGISASVDPLCMTSPPLSVQVCTSRMMKHILTFGGASEFIYYKCKLLLSAFNVKQFSVCSASLSSANLLPNFRIFSTCFPHTPLIFRQFSPNFRIFPACSSSRSHQPGVSLPMR